MSKLQRMLNPSMFLIQVTALTKLAALNVAQPSTDSLLLSGSADPSSGILAAPLDTWH